MRPGIDIVYIPRVPKTETFAKGILTDKEYDEYLSRKDKQVYLAGRYALKEAYMKATGKGLGAAKFKDIEVLTEIEGAPYLMVKGKRIECSLSHDGDYCAAIVILENL